MKISSSKNKFFVIISNENKLWKKEYDLKCMHLEKTICIVVICIENYINR